MPHSFYTHYQICLLCMTTCLAFDESWHRTPRAFGTAATGAAAAGAAAATAAATGAAAAGAAAATAAATGAAAAEAAEAFSPKGSQATFKKPSML